MSIDIPRLEIRNIEFSLHDRKWEDPYEWVRENVEEFLKTEENYSNELLDQYKNDASYLVENTKEKFVSNELGLPQRQGNWWFIPDLPPGAHYPRILRVRAEGVEPPDRERFDSKDADVLLDFEGILSETHANIGSVNLSPCDRYIAWTEDLTGRETYRVRLRVLSTGQEIDTGIKGVSSTVVFSQKGDTFFVIHLDPKNRPCEVTRHSTLSPRESVCVFREDDERFRVRVSRSSSGSLLFVTSSSREVTRNFYAIADDPVDRLIPIDGIASDEAASCAHIPCGDAEFLILTLTSPSQPDGTLMLVPLSEDRTPSPRENWQTLVAHADDRRLSPALALKEHVLLGARENGRNTISIARCSDLCEGRADFIRIEPWGDADAHLALVPEWESHEILVTRASITQEQALYRVKLDEPTVAHRIGPETVAPPSPYVEEQIHARADDGEDVPITIVRRKGIASKAPLLLTGYGAYDANFGQRYNPMLLPLLDAGVVYAIAHVRGGGEKGARWHDAARGLGKPRSFSDFLACRRELVARGLADPSRVVAMGGSAGGLLVAASLNLEPQAFCGVVADSPFVDPLTTMMKPELPLTISDRKEWGDPLSDPKIAQCIQAYSPYHNILAMEYPPVFATCGRDDSRVSAVEPLKWINRLRSEATGGPFLLRVRSGGHVGNSSIDESLEELALQYAWIAARLGVRPTP